MHALPRLATWVTFLVLAMSAQAQTTRQWQLQKTGDAPLELKLVDAQVRQPGEHEVLVRVRATSLNRRDIYVKAGKYPGQMKPNLVPLSDGAGEVVATGAKTTRFRQGDRVAAIFFPLWIDGRPKPEYLGSLGDDAVPAMVAAYPSLGAADRAALAVVLTERRRSLAQDESVRGWPAWNLARTRAQEALARWEP